MATKHKCPDCKGVVVMRVIVDVVVYACLGCDKLWDGEELEANEEVNREGD